MCGVGAAAKHPEGDIQDPWPMTGEQLFEGIAFSGLPPPYPVSYTHLNDELNTVGPLPGATFRFETSAVGVIGFASNQVMSDLAQATGGLFFHNNNDLPNGFRQVGSIPEVSYVLGFHPGEAPVGGKYHKLKVTFSESKAYVKMCIRDRVIRCW